MVVQFSDTRDILRHKQLVFAGASGVIQTGMLELIPKIEQAYPHIILSKVQKSLQRDFVAAFIIEPVSELRLSQYNLSEIDIFGYGINEINLCSTLERIAGTIGFTPAPRRDSRKIEEWNSKFNIEKKRYDLDEKAAKEHEKTVQAVFGARVYQDFSIRYQGLDEKSAREKAALLFDV